MKTARIAFRNIFRNTRRSVMTILAISVGALSVILFGGFVAAIVYGMQTRLIQSTGHLHVYQKGTFEYGPGNPSAYGIGRYEEVKQWIADDAVLKRLVLVVTPILKVYGIAGNFSADASKTFFGIGVVPSDSERMQEWNDYGIASVRRRMPGLSDGDPEGGVIGVGMARMLQLCEPLNVAGCSDSRPNASSGGDGADGSAPGEPSVLDDLNDLLELDRAERAGEDPDRRPRLDLLAATAKGAPNVVTLYVNKAESQGVKEVDDSYVAMHLSLAQRLLYGKGDKKVTGIVVQLKHTRDIPTAGARLAELFSSKGQDYEVKDFRELSPMYGQVISMFASIFTFLALIMGVIVLFTVVNTMSMSVMERVNEIGTIRALGVRRGGVLRQFLMEGCLLGAFGATIGTVLAVGAALSVNRSGLTWVPPTYTVPVPFSVQALENPLLLGATWLGMILLAAASSLVPARKAGRMDIVDALRHI
jgi:putative ABC transport system permease protein